VRNTKRAIVTGLISVPLTLGVPAVAFAGTGSEQGDRGGEQSQRFNQVQSQDQNNTTNQSNINIAPVTQVNPAINVADLFDGLFFQGIDGSEEGGSGEQTGTNSSSRIVQDNRIESSNDQRNSNSTKQSQHADQSAKGNQEQHNSGDNNDDDHNRDNRSGNDNRDNRGGGLLGLGSLLS